MCEYRPLAAESGTMHPARAVVARIQERPDKSFSTYVYYRMSLGAVRLEEEKVVEIRCDEDL